MTKYEKLVNEILETRKRAKAWCRDAEAMNDDMAVTLAVQEIATLETILDACEIKYPI